MHPALRRAEEGPRRLVGGQQSLQRAGMARQGHARCKLPALLVDPDEPDPCMAAVNCRHALLAHGEQAGSRLSWTGDDTRLGGRRDSLETYPEH